MLSPCPTPRNVRHAALALVLLAGLPPDRLTAQCPDGSPPPCARASVGAFSVPGANSVGVMLFNNLTRDTAYAYLSDGLASEIATSLLSVQEEIAGAVATAIAGQLLPQERTVLAVRPTRNPEAYDDFLRGNFQLARRTPGGVARAIEEYGAAVRLDPSFAQAEARIALGYALYLDWGWDFAGVPRDSQLARGSRAAERALALDPSSADGWMARGYLLSFRYPRTCDGVLEALERATRLDSGNAEAWHQYSSLLSTVGRFDRSVETARRAWGSIRRRRARCGVGCASRSRPICRQPRPRMARC